MKKITIIVILVGWIITLYSQSCLPEGITFTTQSQVDSFPINYPNCTEIEGNVWIEGSDISNISSLSVLTSVGGYLYIQGNESLTNVLGLVNLTSVGWGLSISYNPNLVSLSGLDELISVGGGGFGIVGSSSLTNLSGLEGLTQVIGNFTIANCDVLQSISGLEGLIYIGGGFSMFDNPSLTSFSGLENLNTVGAGFVIHDLNGISNLSGLEGLTSIGAPLTIRHNNALTSLTGLEGLTSIGGKLAVEHNNALTSLTGIDNLAAASIAHLFIEDNSSLSTCEVQSICDYLASPNGTVSISDNNQGCDSPQEVEEACLVGIYEQQTDFQLSAFPNPFITSTTIEYELTEPTHVSLTIYNAIGETIYKAEDRLMPVGKHAFIWSPESLSEGLYYVELVSGERVSVIKLIKQ